MCVSIRSVVLTDFSPFLPFSIYSDILKQYLSVNSLRVLGIEFIHFDLYSILAKVIHRISRTPLSNTLFPGPLNVLALFKQKKLRLTGTPDK